MDMRSSQILTAVLTAALLVGIAGPVHAATGTASRGPVVHGIYTDTNGLTRLAFKDARVTITRLGIMQGIFRYTVKGNEITVSGANNGQSMLLEVDDQGCIIGVPGTAQLCKTNSEAKTGGKATGVSGVYASSKSGDGGFRFDFHADRTVDMSGQGISLNAHYAVAGKQVTITVPKSAGGQTLVMQINDRGCIVGADVGELCKVQTNAKPRLGAGPVAAGVWRTYAGTVAGAGPMRYVFHNDGTVVMSAEGASVNGTYSLAGNKVTITGPKAAGGESFVLEIDDQDCLYSPDQPAGPRLCRQ